MKIVIYGCIGLFVLIAIPLRWWLESAPMSSLSIQHELNWDLYYPIKNKPTGYLYEVKNESEGVGIYVATDMELSDQSYAVEQGWTIHFLSKNPAWNPRVCATMPSVLAPNGDVAMLNTERDEKSGKTVWDIFWFKSKEKELVFANINVYKYIGNNVFLNNEQMPYYFGWKNNSLVTYTLDLRTGKLHENFIETIPGMNKIRILRKNTDHTPIIGIYDMESLVDSKYILKNGKLVIYTDSTEELHTSYSENILSNHLNGITSLFTPGSPYETKVFYKEHEIFSFIKEAQVYSYVLGSYQVNR